MLGTETPSVCVIASRGGPFLGRSPMDYLISSGGCPGVSGNLNNMYVNITEEQSQEIQVGQPVDLVWHYEKLVDRLEKEIERLTAELEKERASRGSL